MAALEISEEIRHMHEAVSVIVSSVQMRAAAMSEDDQAAVRMILDGASIRLAEVQNLLKLASGNAVTLPPVLKQLEGEVIAAIDKVQEHTTNFSFHGSFAQMDAMNADVERHLNAGRIAGMSMLFHLAAAMNRVERKERTGPRLSVVGGNSTGG